MGYAPDSYDAEADFAATGTVLCDDCGSRVRPRTLASLPEHNCAERRKHWEQIRILDAGQAPSNRKLPRTT